MIAHDQPTIFDRTKLQACISSKSDGTTKSNGDDDISQVTASIRAITKTASLDFDSIVTLNVGSPDVWDKIVEVTDKPDHALISLADRVVADALVTTNPEVVLVLPVADCNAVAVHDPNRQVLALAHLGWQSTVAELATKVVEYLQQKHGSQPSDLRIYLSPSIRAESYIFERVAQADDPVWQPFLQKNDKGMGVDLPGYNRQRFIEAGVLPEHIEVCPVNTAASDEYFSHYRSVRTGEPEGRFALFARLKG